MITFAAPLDLVLSIVLERFLPMSVYCVGILSILLLGRKLALTLPMQLALSLVFLFQMYRAKSILFRMANSPDELVEAAMMLVGIALLSVLVWCQAQPYYSFHARRWWPALRLGFWRAAGRFLISMACSALFLGLTALTIFLPSGLASFRDEFKRLEADFSHSKIAFERSSAERVRNEELQTQYRLDMVYRTLRESCLLPKTRTLDAACTEVMGNAKANWTALYTTLSASGIAAENKSKTTTNPPPIRLSTMGQLKQDKNAGLGSQAELIDQKLIEINAQLLQARHALAKASVGADEQIIASTTPATNPTTVLASAPTQIQTPKRGNINFGAVVDATLHLQSLQNDPVLAFFLLAECLVSIWAFFLHRRLPTTLYANSNQP